MIKEKKRYYNIDNLKAILIFTVVLGHLCEITSFNGSSVLYMMIYVFHMPAFAFCSGLFAHFDKRKILVNFIYPYLIFQTLYMLFARFVLHSTAAFQYTKPYWLMWYMLAMIIWECALPMFQERSRLKQVLIILAMFGVSLWIGMDKEVSYFLSLSRVLVLFPFFLLGYYFKQSRIFELLGDRTFRKTFAFQQSRLLLTCAVIAITLILLELRETINPKWLYDSYSYDQLDYNVPTRAFFMLSALIITAFLLVVVPNIHIPYFTAIGSHTLPVFLVHGFLIKLLDHFAVFDHVPYVLPAVILSAIVITIVLSDRRVNLLLKPLIQLPERPITTVLQFCRSLAGNVSDRLPSADQMYRSV